MEEKKRKPYYNKDHQMRFQAEHTRRYTIALNDRTDVDIITQLDSVPNKQGYIKQLIREDMARQRIEE